MTIPKAIKLVAAAEDYSGIPPEEFAVVGELPGGGGESTPPAWGDITGKPATFPPTIGTTATTAKAGNAVQTATQTTATAVAPGTATNVQEILAELSARITALENAAG